VRQYSADRIRTVGVFGHGSAGKTSLVEALLFDTKTTTRLGRVEEGNTVTDFDPDEIKRRISVSAAIAPVEWRDTKINLIDTPGYADFAGEIHSTLRVCDAALLVVDAAAGVEVGTEQAWRLIAERDLPRLVFINKMDRDNTDFDRALDSCRDAFGTAVAPIQFPIGHDKGFKGIVDLLSEQAFCFHDNADGCTCRKPGTGLLLQAAKDHRVDPAASFMVGDRWSDVVAGAAAGCKTFLIDLPYSQCDRCRPDYRVADLVHAVDLIIGLIDRKTRGDDVRSSQ